MSSLPNYARQLQEKCNRINSLLAAYTPPPAEVYESPPQRFRMRAEFRIWHDDQECFYVMYPPGKNQQPYRVDSLSIVSQTIQRLMPALLNYVNQRPILCERLFQVEFLSTLTGDCLITLIYHKALDQAWQSAAAGLSQSLNVELVGRSRRQKVAIGKDFLTETLTVNGKTFRYKQCENSFSQPNACVNQLMLQWAQDKTAGCAGDLLELYCGNGNFTIPLARNFSKVLATEVSKSALKAAQCNAAENAMPNVTCVRLSANEIGQALREEREFRRLQHIRLADYDFSTVLVDPPRAGLDPATLALVGEFERIIYISCNPETLANNLEVLSQSHRISDFAIFDQFPYTPHIESGVVLQARSECGRLQQDADESA